MIANWNGRELLPSLLASLAEQELDDFAAVVVDNGSTDGSVALLRDRWPQVRTIALEENLGFAAAVNRGIEESSGEYVAVLNNDVRLDPGWASALVRVLDRAPRAGSATGKLLNANDAGVLDGAGDIVGWDGYCMRRGRGERDRGQYDRREKVFSACAAAALYRRSALDSVGSFDESFFAYIEDADWGFRAQLAGYDCVYEPGAIAFHRGGATSGSLDGFELYHCHRNMIRMMVKDFPLPALVLYAPLALARRLASLARAAGRGQAGTILRAWGGAILSLRHALRERRRIQARRVRGYRELSSRIPALAPVKRRASS